MTATIIATMTQLSNIHRHNKNNVTFLLNTIKKMPKLFFHVNLHVSSILNIYFQSRHGHDSGFQFLMAFLKFFKELFLLNLMI